MSVGASNELIKGAVKLGLDLTIRDQEFDPAIAQLNLDLVDIGCEPSLDPQKIRDPGHQDRLIIGSPSFRRAVRDVTSSIIFREEGLADSLAPIGSTPLVTTEGPRANTAWVPKGAIDLDETAKNATEGVNWVDADEANYRKNIVVRNAALLRAVINGLEAGGYTTSASEKDMRAEFNEILDGLWRRGSYHAFPAAKVVARIMQNADLRRPPDTARSLKRFNSFGRQYGYGLAVLRLLPDEVLASF